MKKKIAATLLIIAALVACKDSNDPEQPTYNGTYPVTSFSKIETKEIQSQPGAHDVTVTHTYYYKAGRLSNFNTTQGYTVGTEYIETQNYTTVVYNENQAIVTDEINNVSTYTLNDKGYAISCIRHEMDGTTRSYTFDYIVNSEGKYFLNKIEEELSQGRKGAIINIEINSYRAIRITEQSGNFSQSYFASVTAGDEILNQWEIPYIFLTELHPLSLHSAAIYGKLLGDAPLSLITQLVPDGSSETTTYTYRTDKKDVDLSCKIVTDSNGRKYVRTIDYSTE